MIEILIQPSGNRAEAETPEAAIVAARTLIADAAHVWAGLGRQTASFYVDGRAVAVDVERIRLS